MFKNIKYFEFDSKMKILFYLIKISGIQNKNNLNCLTLENMIDQT